jgi:hypothetical protein
MFGISGIELLVLFFITVGAPILVLIVVLRLTKNNRRD